MGQPFFCLTRFAETSRSVAQFVGYFTSFRYVPCRRLDSVGLFCGRRGRTYERGGRVRYPEGGLT
jgi:hypothetical protein